MPGEAEEGVFERSGAGFVLESGQGVASEETPGANHRDAVGEQFDLRQSVRGEKKGSIAAAKDLRFQEAAKFGSSDGVQTARGFIQEKNARFV